MTRQLRERLFWKLSLIVLCATGLATGLFPRPGFWSSYVLDMVGPPWNYILVRGLFANSWPPFLRRLFRPAVSLLAIFGFCVVVELAQLFELYDAHFDALDFLAYASILVPVYALDTWWLSKSGPGVSASKEAGPDDRLPSR